MTYTPPPPPAPGGGDVILPPPQPTAPVIVLIVSLAAGAGYFMIGQKVKGILAVALWLIVLIPTCGSGSGLLSILYAVDSFFQARHLADGTPIGAWTFFMHHR